MDDVLQRDPEEPGEEQRIGPLGERAIREAEAAQGLPEEARAFQDDRAPERDPSSHGAGPGGEDTLSVISDTDVPGEAG